MACVQRFFFFEQKILGGTILSGNNDQRRNNTMAEMVKRCSCGCGTFFAFQNVKRSVTVNTKGEFLGEAEDKDAEVISKPYGPYECTRCGRVYKTLEELPDYTELQRAKRALAENMLKECTGFNEVLVLSRQDVFTGILVTDSAIAYAVNSNLNDEKLLSIVVVIPTAAGTIFEIKDAD